MTDANAAFERLKQGNERFAKGMRSVASIVTPESVAAAAAGQKPYAIILACADSRVPVETIFDAGLGELFVMRVAGNILSPSIVGSAEFAAANFGSRLVVVLGHSKCGAVAATVDAVRSGGEAPTPNIGELVTRIRPAVASILEKNPSIDRGEAIAQCIRANVRHVVDDLKKSSTVLTDLAAKDGLRFVGAEYDLATGRVTFLD